MLNNISFTYKLHDKVKIQELENMDGVIVGLWYGDSGKKYLVRYFWNCEAKEVYFYENEIGVKNA